MRLIFMGTPEFAVPALQTLIASHDHEVAAVYTQPPRPAGRGHKEQPSPIHRLAETHHIPVLTPVNLKTLEVQEAFRAWQADVAVVAAYGLLLPQAILDACPLGCINIHPSLLPRWRGAAPIQRTVIAGDKETGVALMQMDKGLDTGDILMLERIPLPPECTSGQLHDLLAERGATLLVKTLEQLKTITPQPQAKEGVTYAAKITKEDGHIDWTQSAHAITCLIRGLNPWPGAYFTYKDEKIKILAAKEEIDAPALPPGNVVYDKQGMAIVCGKGMLRPLHVQRPGRASMPMEAMLRGFAVPEGSVL